MTCIAPRCGAARELGAVFCTKHLAAPSGTRGGWISAWRRAQARANAPTPLDASNIARRLWVGGQPPLDRDLPEFDLLVLCAKEVQPSSLAFSRDVIRVPLPDAALSSHEVRQVMIAARGVSSSLRRGRRVLVTCYAGRNRSALVASIGLGMVTRATPAQLVRLMRERRHPEALSNPHFVELIHRFVGRR
jgi:hypothetical protein